MKRKISNDNNAIISEANVGTSSLHNANASTSNDSAESASKKPATRRTLIIGTRKSQLAMVQTEFVKAQLEKLHPDISFQILGMTTTGDRVQNVALAKIGSKSLFTKELEDALSNKTVDFIVHSLKDMPTVLPDGMTLGAILKREDPRDAVILKKDLHDRHFSLESLPKGSVIGTGSVRRVAQLRRRFPHLVFQDVRGNIDTRLAKLDDASSPYCALILAHAGLTRINRADRVSQTLSDDSILYAVGQGAICIESRADDRDVAAVVSTLEHLDTALRCIAERAFMRGLEGGCSVPLGVWSELAVIGGSKARLLLKGNVCSVDGAKEVRGDIVGEIDLRDADKAKSVAEQMGHDLSLKLVELGAQNILKEIRA